MLNASNRYQKACSLHRHRLGDEGRPYFPKFTAPKSVTIGVPGGSSAAAVAARVGTACVRVESCNPDEQTGADSKAAQSIPAVVLPVGSVGLSDTGDSVASASD